MQSNKKNTSFASGLGIYIIVLLIITIIVWLVLTLFLRSYEKSQPIYSINDYIVNIDENKVNELLKPALNDSSSFVNDELVTENLLASIRNSECVKSSRESAVDKIVYYLHDGDSYIEKVTLVPGSSCGFGFNSWKASEEELFVNNLFKDFSFTVPSSYQVYCNDVLLDDSYITDDKVEYDVLSGLYNYGDVKLPYLVKYFLGALTSDVNVYAIDDNGQKVTSENLNEDYYIDNCSDSEKAELQRYSLDFVRAYVKFLSNSDRNTDGNYYNVIQYVQSGSNLESLLRDAKKSNGFNSSLGDEIKDITVKRYMKVDKNNYFVDVDFTYVTTGQDRSKTEFTNHMKLLLYKGSNGAYQATNMVQY